MFIIEKIALDGLEKAGYEMIRFNNDYSEGAHPSVLERLSDTNMVQTPGYGEDEYCLMAADIIKDLCGNGDIDVHFLVGGTQTNLTLISAALRPHQCAVSAASGHISTHESGAIESTGHKVMELPSSDGKITAEDVRKVHLAHVNDVTHEHIPQPKLVYISNPTELGTVYSKKELQELSEVCREYGLYLYMDGARLGYGLTCEGNDLDLKVITEYCDAFYIGGTKVGALFGEALVIKDKGIREDFRYIIKQKGGLLAKGRLLGVQFLALFEDGLYFGISAHANRMAAIIKEALKEAGCGFLIDTPTNQQFPILPDEVLEKLGENYAYSFWQKTDEGHSAVRFCTSWATREEGARSLANDINDLMRIWNAKNA